MIYPHEMEKRRDLIIRDLAYMGINVLKAAELKKVIYLCRANPTTLIFEKIDDRFEKIDFTKLAGFMRNHGISCIGSSLKQKT